MVRMKYRLFSLIVAIIFMLLAVMPLAAQSTTACEASFRLVEHALLDEPICVPENPERIIALDVTAFELMLMLGIEPIARADEGSLQAIYGNAPAVYERVTAMLEDVPVYGAYYQLNVEFALEVQPDLVFTYAQDPTIEQLSAFTTVVTNPSTTRERSWSELSSFYAAVLGVTEAYQEAMRTYEDRLEVFIEYRDPAFAGASMVYVQDAAGQNYIGLPGLPLWETFADAGFVPVETLPTTPEEAFEEFGDLITPLNLEQIDRIDADIIILANGNIRQNDFEASAELIESYRNDPLWQTLSAVQNDRFYPVSVHWQSNGLVSVHAVLDDMFTFFTDVEASDVSPNPFLVTEDASS
jgi:iron complex transport system substrate-binding protein